MATSLTGTVLRFLACQHVNAKPHDGAITPAILCPDCSRVGHPSAEAEGGIEWYAAPLWTALERAARQGDAGDLDAVAEAARDLFACTHPSTGRSALWSEVGGDKLEMEFCVYCGGVRFVTTPASKFDYGFSLERLRGFLGAPPPKLSDAARDMLRRLAFVPTHAEGAVFPFPPIPVQHELRDAGLLCITLDRWLVTSAGHRAIARILDEHHGLGSTHPSPAAVRA